MEKKKITQELIIVFWIFIIGSLLGYVFEMIIVLFQKGYFESRQGLVFGPFTPVYGIGAIIYYISLKNIRTKDKTKIFFITMLLGGATEYLCSLVQERAFGTISWDYSYLPFNINGRTSLLHCTYWGIAGLIYISYIAPLLEKIREKTNQKSLKVITTMLSVFMILNIGTSCIAANRQSERKKNIEPKNRIDAFFDTYYPDEYMDKIFANKKEI